LNHKNLILLFTFASVGVMMVFELFPNGPREDRFLFSDMEITLQSHIYYASEHVSRLCSILALLFATRHLKLTGLFIVLAIFEFATLIDYLLTYNSSYIVEGFDFNTIKLIVYAVLIGGIIFKDNMEKIKYDKHP
jgi:hypothetical protein